MPDVDTFMKFDGVRYLDMTGGNRQTPATITYRIGMMIKVTIYFLHIFANSVRGLNYGVSSVRMLQHRAS
jgi:hypothetical protein